MLFTLHIDDKSDLIDEFSIEVNYHLDGLTFWATLYVVSLRLRNDLYCVELNSTHSLMLSV